MYEFYMDGVLLPVTPSALTVKISNQNKTINLINEGQVNVLKTPGLSKISFSALLPEQGIPVCVLPERVSAGAVLHEQTGIAQDRLQAV